MKSASPLWLFALATLLILGLGFASVAAQEQGGCDGVVLVSHNVGVGQVGSIYNLGIQATIRNDKTIDVYDVRVVFTFLMPEGVSKTVVFTSTHLAPGVSDDLMAVRSVYELPLKYSVAVAACYQVTELLQAILPLLHAEDPLLQERAIETFAQMSRADAPAVISLFEQHSATDEATARLELAEDFLLIETLARLGDPRAASPLITALATYFQPIYQSAYRSMQAGGEALPLVPLLQRALMRDASLEQVILEAVLALDNEAVPVLADGAIEQAGTPAGKVAAQATLGQLEGAPEILTGEGDAEQRRLIIAALGLAQDPAAVDLLLLDLDAHPIDQKEIVAALTALGAEGIDASLRILESSDPAHRVAAYTALQSMDPEIAAPAVFQVASSQGLPFPAGVDYATALDALRKAADIRRWNRVKPWIVQAKEALSMGNCQTAYQAVSEAYREDRDMATYQETAVQAYACQARALLQIGNVGLAIDLLDEAQARGLLALELDDLHRAAYLDAAQGAYQAGNLQEAAQLLEKAQGLGADQTVDARLFELRLALGEDALEKKQWSSAETYARQAATLASEDDRLAKFILKGLKQRNQAYLIVAGLVVVGLAALIMALGVAPRLSDWSETA